MAEHLDTGRSELERVRRAYAEAVAQAQRNNEQMTELRRLLADMAEQSLELHRDASASIEAIRRDLEQAKRQLKRLSTAKA